MITLTEDQVYERWDILPMTLKEALTSDANSDFIWKTAEAEHVPDEKIYEIGRAVSHVLYGFIHPEDLVSELKDTSGLNPQTASSIANGIAQRIFSPLQQDLNKIYAPLSKMGGGPKILQEIKPSTAPVPVSAVVSQVMRGMPVVMGTVPPSPPPSNVGWSKATTNQPVIKLSQTSMPPPQNMAAARPIASSPSATAIPIKGPVGEFERRTIQQGPPKAPAYVPMPTTPKIPVATGPAPIIIHEDAAFKASQQPPNFRLQLPEEKFGTKSGSGTQSVKPAVMELGGTPPPSSTPKTVHYSEYREAPTATPMAAPKMPSAPAAPQGSRQVTELTSQDKIIYKDYSAADLPKIPPPAAPPPPPPPPPRQ